MRKKANSDKTEFCDFPILHSSTLGDECSVACSKNNMVITIPKSVLRGADREHIRALDLNCRASENLTHFILDVPLTGCGTKSRHAVSSVVYSNEALPVPPMSKDVVSHVPDFQIPFHCFYDNHGLVSAVGLKPSSKKIIFSKKGFGKFVLRLEMFPDIRYGALLFLKTLIANSRRIFYLISLTLSLQTGFQMVNRAMC